MYAVDVYVSTFCITMIFMFQFVLLLKVFSRTINALACFFSSEVLYKLMLFTSIGALTGILFR